MGGAAFGRCRPAPARRASDLFAFKANFRGASLRPDCCRCCRSAAATAAWWWPTTGLTTLACCIRADRLEACRRAAPGLRAGEAVETLLKRECGGVACALRPCARAKAPWLAAGPIDPGIRLAPGDALFRIGNAAGEAHPIIGEGMSMALQSAWLLCAQLLHPAVPRSEPVG